MDIEEAYKLLELNDDASEADVTKAYHKASKQFHPDTATGTHDQQKKINEARKIVLAYLDIRHAVVPVSPQSLSRYIEHAVGRYAGPTSREEAERLQRNALRPIQYAKWLAWGFSGLTGLMATIEKLAPALLRLDKNASEAFTGALTPVAAASGLMGLVLQLVVSWQKNHTEAAVDRLSDRRTCAEMLAQCLNFQEITTFQEGDMRRRGTNKGFTMLLTPLLNLDFSSVLLRKAIEHQLVAVERPDEMTPGYTEHYKLKFDPSVFKPPPPKPPVPTRPSTRTERLRGLGCAAAVLAPTLGLASYLHFSVHTRWALLTLIIGTLVFIGSVIETFAERPLETLEGSKESTNK